MSQCHCYGVTREPDCVVHGGVAVMRCANKECSELVRSPYWTLALVTMDGRSLNFRYYWCSALCLAAWSSKLDNDNLPRGLYV